MRHAWMYLTMGALAGPLGVLGAQEQAPPLLDRIRAAVNLPAMVDSVRHHGGVSEEDVRTVLGDVMQRRVPANETRDLLVEADSAIREHGPVDNFGAFVQAQLAAGLRGPSRAGSHYLLEKFTIGRLGSSWDRKFGKGACRGQLPHRLAAG